MPFTFRHTEITDVILIEPSVHADNRGFFAETYKKTEFVKNGVPHEFVQDNHSYSEKGVIRGLHFQIWPHAQGKLVSVPSGKIFDVAVDLRTNSKTFGKWVSAILSGENRIMLWIPEGFAHGFFAIENSHVTYKITSEYEPNAERGIIWNDHDIGIEWPENSPELSGKDLKWKRFRDQVQLFKWGEEQ